MKENILRFDWLERNKLCCQVEVNFTTGKVTANNITDGLLDPFFGICEPSVDLFYSMLEDRVFPETRVDRDELLEILGLRLYNPLDICRKTHAKVHGDNYWMRFEGETFTWEEVLEYDGKYVEENCKRIIEREKKERLKATQEEDV